MIVIPMAGQSRRFQEAGFSRPKYEMPLLGESLFACCIRSFERYFRSERFVFICRNDVDAARFVNAECERLGIADYLIVSLAEPTRGQAETVLLGLQGAGYSGNESLLIFNIDTIRPHYIFPVAATWCDGYLDVFSGEGDGWSFVRPSASYGALVAQTTEKQRISSLCCTGLYYFARAADFAEVCEDALRNSEAYQRQWKELYIAPMYNTLIAQGKRIMYHETSSDEVHFSGTPAEYKALMARERSLF
ncbi:MAG: glycosyltransferase family 2 protein [Pseudomonadota bacterium]